MTQGINTVHTVYPCTRCNNEDFFISHNTDENNSATGTVGRGGVVVVDSGFSYVVFLPQ